MAAAAGGVTTIVDMPFDEPLPVNTVELLDAKAETLEWIARVDIALNGAPQKGAAMVSKVKWSSYDGMAFGLCVKSTCVQGVKVDAEGRVTGAPGTGTFIRPA